MRTILFAIALASFANPSQAASYSGNDLYKYCSPRGSFILGFIAGVFDASEIDNQALSDYLLESFAIIKDLDQSAANTMALDKAQHRMKAYCAAEKYTRPSL